MTSQLEIMIRAFIDEANALCEQKVSPEVMVSIQQALAATDWFNRTHGIGEGYKLCSPQLQRQWLKAQADMCDRLQKIGGWYD